MTQLTPAPAQDAPIFVGGLMKSGTTLMRVLLANHPRLFGGLETHWFGAGFRDGWRQPDSSIVERLRSFFDLAPGDYTMLAEASEDAEGFLERLMSHCARRAGKARWVEKTPGNAAHLPRIFERWPDARMIHMIRDPRDVYASWKKNAKYDLDRFLADVRAIEASVGQRLGAPSSDARYLEVHYRDLVLAPASTMQRAIAFVGETWVDGIEHNHADRTEYDRVLATTGKASATLDSIAQPIFSSSIGQWRAILSDDERARIERELSDYGRRTGCFPPDDETP